MTQPTTYAELDELQYNDRRTIYWNLRRLEELKEEHKDMVKWIKLYREVHLIETGLKLGLKDAKDAYVFMHPTYWEWKLLEEMERQGEMTKPLPQEKVRWIRTFMARTGCGLIVAYEAHDLCGGEKEHLNPDEEDTLVTRCLLKEDELHRYLSDDLLDAYINAKYS